MIAQFGAPAIEPTKAVPNHSEVPVAPRTAERHKPPPNKSKIPQPILPSNSFQLIKPNAGASAVISIAIIRENSLTPSNGPI